MDIKLSKYDIELAENDSEKYARYKLERVSNYQSFEHWMKSLPPILFKYRSLNTSNDLVRVIDILKENRLYLSTPISLNDPFEGGNIDYLSDDGKDIYKESIKNCRVLSLSKDCFSSPLWTHYADECAGVCIGFITFDTLLCADKLIYTDTVDKKQLWSVDLTNALRKDLLYKNEDWKYESEYRVIKTAADSANEYLDFKPNEIAILIFGEKINKDVKKILKDIILDNILLFDIKADQNKSRYYLTECDSSAPIAYTLEELYKFVFKD